MNSLFGRIARQHRFHRHGLDHQSLADHQESKALAIRRLKPGHQLSLIAPRHDQRRVGAFVAQMHALAQLDAVGTSGIHTHLGQQGLARGLAQSLQALGHKRHGGCIQAPLDGFLAHDVLVGQAHAIGRQHARQRVHHHLRHAQSIGHQTSVLTARAAKALQGVARHVVAACHRDFLDRVGHLLHRDLDETVRHVFGSAAGFHGQFLEVHSHHLGIQRLVRLRPKYRRKKLGLHLAHHHVRIRHSQRPATAVTGRARVGPRALRPHPKTRTVIGQDRTTTCGHGVDAHHGRTHAHTRHLGFKLALELSGKVRHIGGRAAHVKTNHLVVSRQLRRAGHAHNAARRTTQNGVLARKHLRVCQAARRLHEHQFHARHLAGHLVHIAPQNRRQIRIHHRGVTPADQLHHRAGLVRSAHLCEAHFTRQTSGGQLVCGVTPSVHEHDGYRAHALQKTAHQLGAQMHLIERQQDLAIHRHTLLRLHHGAVEQLGQNDLAVKQARAVLVGDAQRVSKALRGHQQGCLAFALQQCVGSHGGAHLHAFDLLGGDRLAGFETQQMADARHRRVAVLFGVFAQKLVRDQVAIRVLAHHIGEGAAPVDPKLPTVFASGCDSGFAHKSLNNQDSKTGSQRSRRTRSLVVHAREHAQQSGQFANVTVQAIVGFQGVNQAALTDVTVALHISTPCVGRRIGDLFAMLLRHHHTQTLQLLQGVIHQMRVFDVHDETDVGQALVTRTVRDVVQHQHIERRQILQARRRHAVDDPAVKRVARHDQAELELAHLGAVGRDQMGRRDDGVGVRDGS